MPEPRGSSRSASIVSSRAIWRSSGSAARAWGSVRRGEDFSAIEAARVIASCDLDEGGRSDDVMASPIGVAEVTR